MLWNAKTMGSKGGSISKRELDPETAKKMVHERERKKAYNAVINALSQGKVQRPECCQKCNQVKTVEAHHPHGYKDPFDLIWLCRDCHEKEHDGFLKSEQRGHRKPLAADEPTERRTIRLPASLARWWDSAGTKRIREILSSAAHDGQRSSGA